MNDELDLSIFEMTGEAVFVQLLHPKTNAPLEDNDGKVGVSVFGADSDAFKKHRHQMQDDAQENFVKRRKGMPSAEFDLKSEQTLAACITQFHNVKVKGGVFESPKDNLRFIQMFPSFKEQINEAMADRSRFMPALSTS